MQSKEGSYWRRKRGTVKKAELNTAFKRNIEATALASPAAKRIKDKLSEFIKGLNTGRFIANVSARLQKSYIKNGSFNFSLLEGYELQPDLPLGFLMQGNYHVSEKNDEVEITIPIRKDLVRRHNKLVSAYYFEAIILWGDPQKTRGLRVESDTSPLYPFNEKLGTECRLSVSLPAKKIPWMVILKLGCHEGNRPAAHARHYGMRVVKVGS